MRIETREEERVIKDKYNVYIAEDGREFYDECACESYEGKLKTDNIMKKLDKYIVKDLTEQIPIHADGCFSEWMHYTWLKAENKEEQAELENIMEDVFETPDQYPLYICYETEDEFEGYASDYSFTIEECMTVTKAYFKMFGIDVEFKK